MRPNRPVTRQTFVPYALVVGVTATSMIGGIQQATLQSLYTSIIVSVPRASANAVWFGDASIVAASLNGIEIVPGSSKTFACRNERQLYELQNPLTQGYQCWAEDIPFVVWDLSTMFLAAAVAPVTVGVVIFPEVFI